MDRLVEGLALVTANGSVDDLVAKRDDLITAFVAATRARADSED